MESEWCPCLLYTAQAGWRMPPPRHRLHKGRCGVCLPQNGSNCAGPKKLAFPKKYVLALRAARCEAHDKLAGETAAFPPAATQCIRQSFQADCRSSAPGFAFLRCARTLNKSTMKLTSKLRLCRMHSETSILWRPATFHKKDVLLFGTHGEKVQKTNN